MTTNTSKPSVGADAPHVLDKISGEHVLRVPLYRSGGWHSALNGEVFRNIEPATGRLLSEHAAGTSEDLEVALTRAVEAQRQWALTPVTERAQIVRELGVRVCAEADRLGLVDARDTGSPVTAMRADATKGGRSLQYFAGLALEMKGNTLPVRQNGLHYTVLEPWGVVARFIAFNHPVLFTCSRLGPALMAGNATILKTPDLAPLGPLAVAEIADGLVPSGLITVLTGLADLGASIVRHPLLRRLSFTGSFPTALKIAEGAAASGVIKTITYELGGKNPIIIFDDADLPAAADAIVHGMNFARLQGQSCGSTSRMIAHTDIYDELLDAVIERASRIVPADPTDPRTIMGAMISRDSRDRVLRMVRRAQDGGARLVLGGDAPAEPPHPDGAFMMPTILTDAAPGSEIAREEVFGPVLAVHRFEDDYEAINLANDIRYGLTAAVWSQDLDRAFRTVGAVEAGYVWVNDVETRFPGVPFGGWKDSGTGLEQGIEELISFTRFKAVNIAIRPT